LLLVRIKTLFNGQQRAIKTAFRFGVINNKIIHRIAPSIFSVQNLIRNFSLGIHQHFSGN
jgi:hypothetical protein